MNRQIHSHHSEGSRAKTPSEYKDFKNLKFYLFRFSWRLGVLAVGIWFLPLVLEACPLCFNASPHRIGLIWAAILLLPIPFALAGLLFWWIRRASSGRFPHY